MVAWTNLTMPKNRWMLIAAGVLLCACASSLFAGPPPRYTLDRVWTTYDGLPDDVVTSMHQTHDGYLWLGTLHGLARFDGVRFSVYREGEVPGLNSSRILKVFEDTRTNLWLGTDNAEVFRISEGKAERVASLGGAREGRLMSICENTQGEVLCFTAQGQLVQGDGGTLTMLASNLQLYFNSRYDFLLASKRGGYWCLAEGRIQRISSSAGAPESNWPYPWTNSSPRAVCEDREGNLIVGTRGEGVFRFDASGGVTQLTKGHGVSGNFILSLCVDREGSLWVGTDGDGLDRVKPQLFQVLEGTQAALVQSACSDGLGELWFGNNYGVNNGAVGHWTNGLLTQFTNQQNVEYRTVRSVLADREHRVWVGTGSGLFPLQAGRFGAKLLDLPVSALYQDSRGVLWAGTLRGLWYREPEGWRRFTTQEGLFANAVQCILDDGQGSLWVGTEGGGLNQFRDGKLTSFTRSNGLPSNTVFALYRDAEGVLWVGTSLGLARYDGRAWQCYSKAEGLVSDSISYLVEDGQGYLWLGSAAGLMRIRKQALNDLAQGGVRTVPVRAYGNADGLPTGRCTEGFQPGAARTPEGTLWFPTSKGLVYVKPAELLVNTNPPPVVIESVWVDGELQSGKTLRAPSPTTVTVPARKEALDIVFTSLNLSAPEKTTFRYRLAPHETIWTTTTGGNRKAHYPPLPSGPYTFHVQACNEDGIWSTADATLEVTVLPPFWHTWWFITVTSACFLMLVVSFVHYVSTQRLHRQLEGLRQKEALEKERARIARDIHDQVGANLTQVSLLGELVESDKDDPKEVQAHARQISQTALETTRALDEIVWTVNPSNDTLDGLINYICKYAQEYLAMAELRYRLEAPEHLPSTPISPELRHNVFLAAKEAVNNVVKHSKATSAWLRLQLGPDRFMLEIEDNGRGVPASADKKGRNGLKNMRKRMEDIGGKFELGAGAEGGTRVRLVAPLQRNHAQ